MITIEHQDKLLRVTVFGELTLEDFGRFERAVDRELDQGTGINLLLDLNSMSGFTVDVAWEEVQFNHKHVGDYQKIAIITSDQWLAWTSWLAGVFIQADVQQFPDAASARFWLQE